MTTEKLPEQLTTEIILRDGVRCVYCLAGRADGAALTVDHLLARSWGGDETDVMNLVCACRACNDAKGNMDTVAFAGMVERYAPTLPALARFGKAPTAASILARVAAAIARPIDPEAAREALRIIRAQRRGK